MSGARFAGPGAETLSALRSSRAEGEIEGDTLLAPDVTLRPDPHGTVRGAFTSPAGRLAEIRTHIVRPGQWLGLHVALGPLPLGDAAILGIWCRTNADRGMAVRPCLRSGRADGGLDDVLFPLHVATHAAASDHLDALVLGRDAGLPPEAPWRELILFLPLHDFAWGLQDLRLFLA